MKKFLIATSILASVATAAYATSPVTLFARVAEMSADGQLNPQPLDDIPFTGRSFTTKEECEGYPTTDIGKKMVDILGEMLKQRYPKAASFGIKFHCEDGGPGRSYNDPPHHAPSTEDVRPLAPLGGKI